MKKGPAVTTDQPIDEKTTDTLRERLTGALLQPGDELYKTASQAWNLQAQQHPALVVMAATAEDIVAAVQFARDTNIGIGVMSTGHGVGTPCDGGLLINTSRMRGVEIDPVSRTATVEAGALWKDVIPPAYTHGLTGLPGSASHVGVVGYTLGGGFGYLGRKYGLSSASVISANIVTADGRLIRASTDENTQLFRALKGSGWNFGVITSLTFRLYPLTDVYGGAVFYPIEYAHEALSLYAQWCAGLPDEMTTAFAFMNIPPLPVVPEPLRGRSVIVIKGCYCGKTPEAGAALFRPVRKELGAPIMDTFNVISVTEMDAISKDPVDPTGVLQYGCLLSNLSVEAINTLLKIAGAGSGSPLTIVELRGLGGALRINSQDMDLFGDGSAQFSMNALGATVTPELAERVSAHLSVLANATRQFQTGKTFINFVEVAPSTDSVRAAYTEEDWQQLVALKTLYDPKNIFRFNRNIPPQFPA